MLAKSILTEWWFWVLGPGEMLIGLAVTIVAAPFVLIWSLIKGEK